MTGKLGVMAPAMRDEQRRERLREYDVALASARSPVAVLSMFVREREARATGELLEEAFAATAVDDIDEADRLPAAVWVALRQGDVDATVAALVRLSPDDFVLAAHEELDSTYRITTVEERRALPDVARLEAQLAAFLHIPRDVIAMISSWGEDDPRTSAEVESLVEQRFGPRSVERAGARAAQRTVQHPLQSTAQHSDQSAAENADQGPAGGAVDDAESGPVETALFEVSAPEDDGCGPAAVLRMSSAEFSALLSLNPEQGAVLDTLVRQTAITIDAAS